MSTACSTNNVQVSYCEGPYNTPEGFRQLLVQMQEYEKPSNAKTWGRLFYLALPPTVYLDVLTNIRCECQPGFELFLFHCTLFCKVCMRLTGLIVCGALKPAGTETQMHVPLTHKHKILLEVL